MQSARNRPGTVQAAANDLTHPAQVLYHNEQSCKLYWWLDFYLHLGQMRGLNLPSQEEFTQKAREQKVNRSFLHNNFTIVPTTPSLYRLSNEDLLEASDLHVIAYHAVCIASLPNHWRRRVEDEWNCEMTPIPMDPVNPLRLTATEAPKPGSIQTRQAKRWVVELYSQYESGAPVKPRESQIRRLKWFKQCLIGLGEFMEKNGLFHVGFPVFVGCTSQTQREWVHYGTALNEWQAAHKGFVVTLHQIA